jgi:polyisoprenoid-binding protein YceI
MKTNFLKWTLLTLLIVGCQNSAKNEMAKRDKDSNVVSNNGPNYEGGNKPANRLFPDKLRYLPIAITAAHYPNPCYANLEEGMYVWKHNTTIVASEDLQLVEYGSFVYTEKGWYLRVSMTPEEFADHYHCKDAQLKRGIVYTDEKSWRRSDTLIAGDAMWYYIAKDKNGKLVKGIAPIETEGKLIDAANHKNNILKCDMIWTGYGEIGNYSLTGKVKLKEGSIEFSNDTLKTAHIIIDLNTITHEANNLVEHLKSSDFFNVAKFPFAELQIKSIDNSNIKLPKITADLKIKDITKTIQFPIGILKGENAVTLKGRISIDRTVFGIKYNSKSFFSNLGDQAIKNNFDLIFEAEVSE